MQKFRTDRMFKRYKTKQIKMFLSLVRSFSLVHVCRSALVQEFNNSGSLFRTFSSLNKKKYKMSLKYKTLEKGAPNSTDYRIFFRKFLFKEDLTK